MGKRGGSSGVGYGKNRLPVNDAQIKHIFRDGTGHLPDTDENRILIERLINNKSNFKGKDIRGNEWYIKTLEDGSQLWARVQNGVLNNGGKNIDPIMWDNDTGLYQNNNNKKK